MSTAAKYIRSAVEKRGWKAGSTLEDKVTLLLSLEGFLPTDLVQEYRIGRFRLDFADPDVQIAIEADGWHHRSPAGIARDAERDAWLSEQGWTVLRISDEGPEEELRGRVCKAAQKLRDERAWRRLPVHRTEAKPKRQRAQEVLKSAAPSESERRLNARAAALERWANTDDRAAATAPARKAALERFERQVDPDGVLPPAERRRRAEAAKKAHMLRLAAKSVAARKAKRRAKSKTKATEEVA